MKSIGARKIGWFGILIIMGSLICTGCGVTVNDVGNSAINGIGDKIDYDSGVDYYREHGMNRKDAERNAYEDQIWDKMDK
jgi:hypothetical protein